MAYGFVTAILVTIPPVNRLLCHVVYAGQVTCTASDYSTLLFWALSIAIIGVTQSLYALPLHRYFWKHNRLDTAKGIAIAAFITFVLSGSCVAGLDY